MRRQNPPQASLEQARALEKYLNRTSIATIYAVMATASFAFAAALYGVLVYDNLVRPDILTLTGFGVIALLPGVLAVLAYRRTSGDPVSVLLRGLADSRRRPLPVKPVPIPFKVFLKTGEELCVNFCFQFPAKFHTEAVKEQLICYVRTALDQQCMVLTEAPEEEEIEEAMDRVLQKLAREHGIPVLYSEVREVHKVRDEYSRRDDLSASEFLGTGTLGLVGATRRR